MISLTRPENFNPKFRGVEMYLVHDGRFLLLRYTKKFNKRWSGVGGKINAKESAKDAAIRETLEESGIRLDPKKVKFLFDSFVKYPEFDFEWSSFRCDLDKEPAVTLSPEHDEYRWVTPDEALTMDIMEDEDWCIKRTFDLDFP